jgi:hypothetical protein
VKRRWIVAASVLITALLVAASACTTPSAADQASYNTSVAADNFEVNRRIVVVNLRTEAPLFSVEGPCSITRDGDLVIICKEGSNPDRFAKHYIGLGPAAGDGVTWISTQLGPIEASTYRTRIIWRPTTFVPDVELDLGL